MGVDSCTWCLSFTQVSTCCGKWQLQPISGRTMVVSPPPRAPLPKKRSQFYFLIVLKIMERNGYIQFRVENTFDFKRYCILRQKDVVFVRIILNLMRAPNKSGQVFIYSCIFPSTESPFIAGFQVFVGARLHVTGGTLRGGRAIEGEASIAGSF